jgi:hypothetical protein
MKKIPLKNNTNNRLQSYQMSETSDIASTASSEIEKFLLKHPSTISVKNVENIPEYQQRDIDLVWKYKKDNTVHIKTIEIKADRYYKTGNYFFETISNEDKGTPGCFMYSTADYLFYYFIDEKELHIMPLKKARDWFTERITRFKERKTSTPVGQHKYYITVGRLVPRLIFKNEFKKIRIIKL